MRMNSLWHRCTDGPARWAVVGGFIVACNTPQPGSDTTSRTLVADSLVSPTHSGYVTFGPEVRTFRPCGASEPVWAVDRSSALWPTYGQLAAGLPPYGEMFAIVRGQLSGAPTDGFGAAYGGQISIDEVVYVAHEGYDCSLTLSAFWARGSGNEPFWSFEITSRGVRFSPLGGPELTWEDLDVETNNNTTLITAVALSTLRVTLQKLPCTDTMSGAYFSHTSVVEVSGTRYLGCAIRGTGQPPRGMR